VPCKKPHGCQCWKCGKLEALRKWVEILNRLIITFVTIFTLIKLLS